MNRSRMCHQIHCKCNHENMCLSGNGHLTPLDYRKEDICTCLNLNKMSVEETREAISFFLVNGMLRDLLKSMQAKELFNDYHVSSCLDLYKLASTSCGNIAFLDRDTDPCSRSMFSIRGHISMHPWFSIKTPSMPEHLCWKLVSISTFISISISIVGEQPFYKAIRNL